MCLLQALVAERWLGGAKSRQVGQATRPVFAEGMLLAPQLRSNAPTIIIENDEVQPPQPLPLICSVEVLLQSKLQGVVTKMADGYSASLNDCGMLRSPSSVTRLVDLQGYWLPSLQACDTTPGASDQTCAAAQSDPRSQHRATSTKSNRSI